MGFLYQADELPDLPYTPKPGSKKSFIESTSGMGTLWTPRPVPGSNGAWVYEGDQSAKSTCTVVNGFWELSKYPAEDLIVTWHPNYYARPN